MSKQRTPKLRVNDVYATLDTLAPFAHAEPWDNVGLLAGWAEAPVSQVLMAIDLTDAVAGEALDKGADLLVLYHPPIFKGISAITADADGPTNLLPDLLANRVSIIALHTALDVAVGGTNDVLLEPFDIVRQFPLESAGDDGQTFKLVVFVPPAEVDSLRPALSAAGAGVIGHYSECSYELAGRGTFRGDETTNPTVGRKLVLEYADETRLEMVVPRKCLAAVVRTLYEKHSYEEPAFDLYPLHVPRNRGQVGLGRVGVLRKPTRGDVLVKALASHVDLGCATVVGSLKRSFRSVVAAAGAFGVRSFHDPEALVLTGEFKHHDALALQRRGVTAVHLDHYASERPMLTVLREKLKKRLRDLRVHIARVDRTPFVPVSVKPKVNKRK